MLSEILCLVRGRFIQSILFILMISVPVSAYSQPTFSKTFFPDTIGPGSIATLQFTIIVTDPSPVTDLAFTDTFPEGMIIATPAQAVTNCGGTLTAPEGDTGITFTGGTLEGANSCSITVDVTSSTPGIHTNTSSRLTSNAGDSDPASAALTVDEDRPGFNKFFSPTAVSLGERSTLTFVIDNTSNPNPALYLNFTDNLPVGMIVADPANTSTTCTDSSGNPNEDTITAQPGTSVISYGPIDAQVAAATSCTVTVDVATTSVGRLNNTSGDLTSVVVDYPAMISGKAGAILDVTAGTLHLVKSFTNDPVPPGSTVNLEFTISNFDRALSATNISFSDDLDATLSGLMATALPQSDVCGAGSTLTGTSLPTLTGGNLAPGESCTFTVTLQVPAVAATGIHTNTTSSVTADVDGQGYVFTAASDDLFIDEAPVLTTSFLTDPVGAGQTTTIEFTITNTSAASGATNIAFFDELTSFLPFSVSVTLPPVPDPPCGEGSSISITSLDTDYKGLSFTGGSLAAAGQAGDSCTFTVDLTIPPGMPSGTYRNTTDPITATVNGQTQTGRTASDSFSVVSGPTLTKSFTNDPVLPGGTVTLQFTLSHDSAAAGDATEISFTDDLDAILPEEISLTATGLPKSDTCGTGSLFTTTIDPTNGHTNLNLSGASLAPGESCIFNVSLQVPLTALPGKYINRTSNVTAQVAGLDVIGNPAQDDLLVDGLSFSKSFTTGPVIPGDTTTLEFTINNTSPSANITNIFFTDTLSAVLSGLVASGLPAVDVCGAGSQLFGTDVLFFTGGNLAPQTSCTFSIPVQIPPGAASNTYLNTTSILTASFEGSAVVIDPATADLMLDTSLLHLTKSFTDAPAISGGTVNLTFTLTNQHSTQPATAIQFTDDLDAALAGLVANALPAADICGAGSSLSGTGSLAFTGGSLDPDESCTFSVELQVPSGLPSGTMATNTTSQVIGVIDGLSVTGDPAIDVLEVGFLTFNKAFSGKTKAGETVTLSFSLENNNPVSMAANLHFSDDLGSMFPGLVATGLPVNDACGTGSVLSGTDVISMFGANLEPGELCSFSINLQVPMNAPHGFFLNTSSPLTVQGEIMTSPATAILEVDNDTDDDTIMDQVDNCPNISNHDQANNDGDSLGDVCDTDDDNDTVPDTSDNCPFTVNSNQADFDGDKTGDICDKDGDNDGMPDTWENDNGLNPYDPFDANLDNDDDGFSNQEEYGFGSDPNIFDTDANKNGVPDSIDFLRGTIPPLFLLLNH